MARDVEVERRLLNWARWKRGVSVGGLGHGAPSASAAAGFSGGGGYREAVIPVWDTEAAVTDQAVAALPDELRGTVRVVYLDPAPEATMALELGIAVRTLHARVERAHGLVRGWLAEREQRLRAERERVDRLQRGA